MRPIGILHFISASYYPELSFSDSFAEAVSVSTVLASCPPSKTLTLGRADYTFSSYPWAGLLAGSGLLADFHVSSVRPCSFSPIGALLTHLSLRVHLSVPLPQSQQTFVHSILQRKGKFSQLFATTLQSIISLVSLIACCHCERLVLWTYFLCPGAVNLSSIFKPLILNCVYLCVRLG